MARPQSQDGKHVGSTMKIFLQFLPAQFSSLTLFKKLNQIYNFGGGDTLTIFSHQHYQIDRDPTKVLDEIISFSPTNSLKVTLDQMDLVNSIASVRMSDREKVKVLSLWKGNDQIAMKFAFMFPRGKKSTDFGDSIAFPLAPPSGQISQK